MQQPFGVLKNFLGCSTPDAEKASTVRVVLITLERQKLVFLDFNRHAALGWQTIHRTHCRDLALLDHTFSLMLL
jgi:hypothetical protein